MDTPEAEPQDGPNRDHTRIGHADRAAALRALDEHFTAGRLDVEEYGDRSAAAAAAVRAADLVPLFEDLPAPRPPFAGPSATDLERLAVPRRPGRAPVAMVAITLLPLLAVLTVVLVAGSGVPPVGFAFLPLVFVLLAGRAHRHGPGG